MDGETVDRVNRPPRFLARSLWGTVPWFSTAIGNGLEIDGVTRYHGKPPWCTMASISGMHFTRGETDSGFDIIIVDKG